MLDLTNSEKISIAILGFGVFSFSFMNALGWIIGLFCLGYFIVAGCNYYLKHRGFYLKRSHQNKLIHDTYHNLNEGIILIDKDKYTILHCNKVACRLLNVEHIYQLIGSDIFSFINNDEFKSNLNKISKLRGRHDRQAQFRCKFLKGKFEHTAALLTIQAVEIDNHWRILLSIDNIFSLNKVFEAHQKQNQFYQMILATANSGVVITNQYGKVLVWNEYAVRTFGWLEDEMLNQPLSHLLMEKDKNRLSHILHRLLNVNRDDKPVECLDVMMKTRAGITIPMLVYLTCTEYQMENYICIVMNDVTELKNIEKSLKKTSDKLKESNHELELFASIASHDLKEPLNTISLYSTMMSDLLDLPSQESIAELKDKCNKINNQTEHLKLLIDTLLEYSRLSSLDFDLQPVEMKKIIDRVNNSLESMAKDKHITINVENDFPVVIAEPMKLYQVFTNLVSNAVKYNNNDNVNIDIGYKLSDHCNYVVVSVKDNGLGIPESAYDSIFHIFKRLKNKKGADGSGAGLTIVKHIINRFGGEIWLESEVNVGTTFFFSLRNAEVINNQKVRHIHENKSAASR